MCSYNTSKPEQYCIQLLYVMHAISDVPFDRLLRPRFASMILLSHHYYVSCHIRVYLFNYGITPLVIVLVLTILSL